MSDLIVICGTENLNRRGDVVFVHGLNGDARSTWQPAGQPERFWPEWIGEDLPNVGVWSVGYPANAFAWEGYTMPLADRAVNILISLHTNEIGTKRPIVFITHSMGGLLVKEMLKKATDGSVSEGEGLALNTRGVVFLSTPHSGSDLANFVDFVKVLLPSDSLRELKPNEPRLRELNTWYRNNVGKLGIETQVYCERRPTRAGEGWFRERFEAMVVDANCADPGIPGVTAVPMDDDHITISRPERSSMLYLRIKEFVNDCLKPSRNVGVSEEEDGGDLPEENIQVFPESLNYPDYSQQCQNIIRQPGALLRIKAPRKMGKTFLLKRVLADVQKDLGYRIAEVNLWRANLDTRQDLDKLLRWLCEQVCLELRLPINVHSEWQSKSPITPNDNCTRFFNKHFLNNSEPLILGLDNLDLIFNYPTVADDFLGLIRAWVEDKTETWLRLRMVIVYMQHYDTTIDNHSPLNVGKEITLPDLTMFQIQQLIQECGLQLTDLDIRQLNDLVGGHPALILLALHHVYIIRDHTLVSLLESAHTDESIYSNYLESHLRYLKNNKDLAMIMKKVVCSTTPMKSYDCSDSASSTRKLREVGLIKFKSNDIYPANKLLRLYLRDRL
jgi:pimeloyl-ACP methyl ester carboxylesterase